MTTKPDDIPQWAWDRVEGLPLHGDSYCDDDDLAPIARALLNAKNDAYEECAKIAGPIHYEGRMSDYEKQAFDIRDVVAQAIRNLKHETEV